MCSLSHVSSENYIRVYDRFRSVLPDRCQHLYLFLVLDCAARTELGSDTSHAHTLRCFKHGLLSSLCIPHFCVSEQLSTLGVVSLGYISVVYPLLLTLVLYSLIKLHHRGCRLVVAIWRPLHRYFIRFRRFWQTSTSLMDVFATFLLLSYSKMLFVSFNLA